MNSNKPKMSLEDFAWIWIAGFFAVLAGALTLLVLELDDELITHVMLKPLYPGLYTAFVMNHDDHLTATIFTSVLVNALAYGIAVIFLRLLWRYIRNYHSFQPAASSKENLS